MMESFFKVASWVLVAWLSLVVLGFGLVVTLFGYILRRISKDHRRMMK